MQWLKAWFGEWFKAWRTWKVTVILQMHPVERGHHRNIVARKEILMKSIELLCKDDRMGEMGGHSWEK